MLTIKERKLSIADLLDLKALSGHNLNEARELETMIRGFESGTTEMEDLITETKDGFPLNGMWKEFQKVIKIWNAQRDALTNLLTFQVTAPIEGVRYPTEAEFQEATEFGEPTGIRLGPSLRHGYDFKWYDLAIRYTWQFLAETTQAQLVALNNTALEADNRLVFTKIMARLFNNVTNVADIDGDNVNVYGFYNADTQVPPKWKTTVHVASHEHYMASGAGTVVSEDLDDLIANVTHHGYSQIQGYTLVLMVNEQEADVIRTFTTAGGDKFTFIPSNAGLGGIIMAANGGILGAPSMKQFPGLVTIGSYGSALIVMEDYVPAGYMVCFATGGPDNIGNPIGMRQHETSSLQGLKLVKGRTPDYPLVDSFYVHGMGTGVRHRGAGAVMKITAGSYSIPAAYA